MGIKTTSMGSLSVLCVFADRTPDRGIDHRYEAGSFPESASCVTSSIRFPAVKKALIMEKIAV
jgi:hypothetical protein